RSPEEVDERLQLGFDEREVGGDGVRAGPRGAAVARAVVAVVAVERREGAGTGRAGVGGACVAVVADDVRLGARSGVAGVRRAAVAVVAVRGPATERVHAHAPVVDGGDERVGAAAEPVAVGAEEAELDRAAGGGEVGMRSATEPVGPQADEVPGLLALQG